MEVDKATYSASVVDNAIAFCNLEAQIALTVIVVYVKRHGGSPESDVRRSISSVSGRLSKNSERYNYDSMQAVTISPRTRYSKDWQLK